MVGKNWEDKMEYENFTYFGWDPLAQKRFAKLISYKLKREYSEMCGFVRARMSLTIVRSYSLLLCGPTDKGAHIQQRPQLTDGVVMALPASWRC